MKEQLNYNKGQGAEKNWLVEERSFDERFTGKCESIFYQGNGYLGLRNALEERYLATTRGLFVTGTFNKASAEEVTELPNVPDITNAELTVNGHRFSMTPENTEAYSRTLNLHTGETVRSLVWTGPEGEKVQLCFRRFVSAHNVHLIGNLIEVTPLSGDVKLHVVSGIDGQVTNSGAQHFTETAKRAYDETYLEFTAVTTESGVSVSVHTAHRLLSGGKEIQADSARIGDDRRKIFSQYDLTVKKGETVRLEKLSAVHSTRDLEYAELSEAEALQRLNGDGLDLVKAALQSGYDRLFEESKAAWSRFWEDQDIKIESSNDFDQLAIRFALYHLEIMTRKGDGRVGIAAKGLSGEGYKGHSFWDTETFIFPYFQMARPETARTLLEYRYRGLYGARLKAKDNGFEGAQYPWESAWISDGEVTPWIVGVNVHTGDPMYCLTGKIELHITADIIYALWQYYISTGDEKFMEDCGYEMILETARFWNSRLEWVSEHDRYEIRDVIGPDEYQEHVDNNAYTNHLAKYNMDLALRVLELLEAEKPQLYKKLSALADLKALKVSLEEKLPKMYLPQPDPETEIIPQFDGYFDLKYIDLKPYKEAPVVGTIFHDYSNEELQDYQAAKQADIVELLYQLEDMVSLDVKRKNYFYYEERTLHDSSLSKAIHSVTACDLGLSREAYDMFLKAAATDLGQEMRSSNAGIHSANMGGIWQDVVMGFGGVRISHGKLRINPKLPEGWEKLTYPLYWRGSRLEVVVDRQSVCINNSGEDVEAVVAGKDVVLKHGENKLALA